MSIGLALLNVQVFALLNVQGAITLQTYKRCATVLPAQLSLQAGCTCTAVQLVA